MSNVEYGLIMQELERGDSGLRSFVSVQGALVMYPIYTFGSDEQKQRWLPQLQSGRPSAVSGLPSRTSDRTPPACAPRRRRDGARWVLNGEKTWITNGGDRGYRRSLGAHRRRHSRIPRGTRNAGILNLGHPRQAVNARLRHVEPGVLGLPRAGERDAARRERFERTRSPA